MAANPGDDTIAVLAAAGLIFIWALLLGVWKYRQMAAAPDGLAHPYVDTAHRAALLYSFATLLIAAFVELSGWSAGVNAAAAFTVIAFFVAAIGSYCWHGYARDTDNQLRLINHQHPQGLLLPGRKFWQFSVGANHSDNPYGLGLAHSLYWPVFFKRSDIKFWLLKH